ncbi:2-polyprenyl-6-methoxyphenol hydroxylase-like oxidoreductase (plasmid) [Azospirillum argentinense]|uniref:2-polyprenyl-6-methoxyphenol hydroxylase-like oxidoreductase n=2 Tax=Azospirillum argentinense TaxID=2970906 RepID=A0A4D8PVP0_9PROT|nr:2-polyprenyl-6-methoxyphenol hydroxylase-like oxidoreductase [Azospirillum argentinense]
MFDMPIGNHAIVIGGSISGMLAARVLSESFAHVTVLERDRYGDGPALRKGQPQGWHVHLILARGRMELERLFPGLGPDLEAAGAVCFQWSEGARVNGPFGWLPDYTSDRLLVRGSTRALLDWHVRDHLLRLPNVRMEEGCAVKGLLTDPSRRAVTGVRVARDSGDSEIYGDLVVDTSGRASASLKWLEEIGCAAPPESVVDCHLAYSCRWYEAPKDASSRWKLISTQPKAPDDPLSAAIFPIEGDRYIGGLATIGLKSVPDDDAGFLELAKSLRTPEFHAWFSAAKPLSPIYTFRQAPNRVRHFERVPNLPDRYLPMGDVVGTLNPIYGQGITLAALSALTLGDSLARASGPDPLSAAVRSHLQRLPREVYATPWIMAALGDSLWPGTTIAVQSRFQRWLLREPWLWLFRRFSVAINRMAAEDPELARGLMEVMHMIKPPAEVLNGRLMRRAFWRMFRAPRPVPGVVPAPSR